MTKLLTWACICGSRYATMAEWSKCYKSHEVVVADKRYTKVFRKGSRS